VGRNRAAGRGPRRWAVRVLPHAPKPPRRHVSRRTHHPAFRRRDNPRVAPAGQRQEPICFTCMSEPAKTSPSFVGRKSKQHSRAPHSLPSPQQISPAFGLGCLGAFQFWRGFERVEERVADEGAHPARQVQRSRVALHQRVAGRQEAEELPGAWRSRRCRARRQA
jgi:hypothetical protein